MPYLEPLTHEFERNANLTDALPMAKYMKNNFSFLGLKSPIRREIQNSFIKQYGLPDIKNIESTIEDLWNREEREYQYFAIDLMDKIKKNLPKEIIFVYVDLVIRKSWWDTIDLIAAKLIGFHLSKFIELEHMAGDWAINQNMWLRRTALLYQLKYKSNTNKELLREYIELNLGSNEFFINKAIGWALREFSKTDPKFVVQFVKDHPELSNLSRKEALKKIL